LGKTTDGDRFARDALALHARLFRLWHRYRGGTIDRGQLIAKAMPIEKRFFALGERRLDSKDAAVCALAALFFAHTERLFAFIYHPGVEPTNNISERTIRTAVQWRKICFGNRSDAGEIVTARLLSAAARGDEARESPNGFLSTAAGKAHAHGLPQPEGAVLEGQAGTFPCLLYACRIAAYRAALQRLLRIDQCAGDTLPALPALLLQLPDRPPQACDLGQGDRTAVFSS